MPQLADFMTDRLPVTVGAGLLVQKEVVLCRWRLSLVALCH